MKPQLLEKNMLGQAAPFSCASPNQILVKVRASGVNFTDVEQVRGEAAGTLPRMPSNNR
jgi:NADPH:quinone reductase-like Zn-dependent oxidoreductase